MQTTTPLQKKNWEKCALEDLVLKDCISGDIRYQSADCMGINPHEALKPAQKFVKHGFITSLPGLVSLYSNNPEHAIRIMSYTLFQEEWAGRTRQKKPVVVEVYGGGKLSTSDSFDEEYKNKDKIMRGKFGYWTDQGLNDRGFFECVQIEEGEFHDLLDGKLRGNRTIDVISYSDIKRMNISRLSKPYAAVLDFDLAKKLESGLHTLSPLRKSHLFRLRAGGRNQAENLLDEIYSTRGDTLIGNWHAFGRIKSQHPEIRILKFHGLFDLIRGLDGDTLLNGPATYLALEPYNTPQQLILL